MKMWTFKAADELAEFVREFEEQPDKVLYANYAELTAMLRARHKNRRVENEADKYFYRDMAIQDTVTLMKLAEVSQYPSDTRWMLKLPMLITEKERK